MNDNASRHSDSSGFRRDGSRSQGQQDAGNAAFGAPQRLQLNRTLPGAHAFTATLNSTDTPRNFMRNYASCSKAASLTVAASTSRLCASCTIIEASVH